MSQKTKKEVNPSSMFDRLFSRGVAVATGYGEVESGQEPVAAAVSNGPSAAPKATVFAPAPVAEAKKNSERATVTGDGNRYYGTFSLADVAKEHLGTYSSFTK